MTSAVNAAQIQAGIAKLRDGGLVAFPTDTLYALGADATNDAAVERLFLVKRREDGKPLPLFVADLEMAAEAGEMTAAAERLARDFWPGALTIVVRVRPSFHSIALAGGGTVALRAPDDPTALELIRGLGRPMTGTSANRSGGAEPVTAEEVRAQIGDVVDLVIDGGVCPTGRPSTIVDCTQDPPRILREGAIARERIERAAGPAA